MLHYFQKITFMFSNMTSLLLFAYISFHMSYNSVNSPKFLNATTTHVGHIQELHTCFGSEKWPSETVSVRVFFRQAASFSPLSIKVQQKLLCFIPGDGWSLGPDFLPGPTRLWHGVIRPANPGILIHVVEKEEDWAWRVHPVPAVLCKHINISLPLPVYEKWHPSIRKVTVLNLCKQLLEAVP